jgi:hypothetical protein
MKCAYVEIQQMIYICGLFAEFYGNFNIPDAGKKEFSNIIVFQLKEFTKTRNTFDKRVS